MKKIQSVIILLIAWILYIPLLHAQDSIVQYFASNPDYKKRFVLRTNEAAIPEYELPDPLIANNGKRITSAEMWWRERRPEIFSMFENEMYGKTPFYSAAYKELLPTPKIEILSEKSDALEGKATLREVRLYFSTGAGSPYLDVLLFLPNKVKTPVPAFVMLNFRGNQSVTDERCVRISASWMTPREDGTVNNYSATELSRGADKSRWPVEMIIDSGYALATACYQDIDPDYDDDFQNGIHPLFYKERQKKPAANEWGSIGAWAWGMSRIMDYLEKEARINPEMVIVAGHSRLGKAALWAGAQDQRFAAVIANDSGCGGGALSKRVYGETVELLCYVRPHWFCANFKYYACNEKELAFDQHDLIALIAPRPVYLATAEDDIVADPKGELLSLLNADAVYRLLGTDGTGNVIGKYTLQKKGAMIYDTKMPPVNQSIGANIGFHLRSGGHDITRFDWEQFIQFANRNFHRLP